MNSSSKVPPRFVPTLTEVVQPESDTSQDVSGELHTNAEVPEEVDTSEPLAPVALEEVATGSFHSPWLADGLYARRKPAAIPHELPPLPDSLPPQQPFAHVDAAKDSVDEPQADEVELPEVGAEKAKDTAPEIPESVEPVEPIIDAASAEAAPNQAAELVEQDERLAWNAEAPQVTEEYLVHRLMQRVDLVLDQRLKEAISIVVQEQTRSIVLRLREEVESVVRQAVYEAVEEELAQQTKPKPKA